MSNKSFTIGFIGYIVLSGFQKRDSLHEGKSLDSE
jgi:hypothetical protein